MKIPPKINSVVQNYLSEMIPGGDQKVLIGGVLSMIAEITTHNRVTLGFWERPLLTNHFEYLQGASGSNKGLIDTCKSNILGGIRNVNEKELERYRNLYNEELDIFVEERKEQDRFKTKVKRERFVNRYRLNNTTPVITGGSPQSFFEQRYILGKIGLGACMFVEDEFMAFIHDPKNKAILESIKKTYEGGKSVDTGAMMRAKYNSNNVPQNASFHSSNPDGDGLEDFWNRGFGRRSLIYNIPMVKHVKEDYIDSLDRRKRVRAGLIESREFFEEMSKILSFDGKRIRIGNIAIKKEKDDFVEPIKFSYKKIKLPDECEELFHNHHQDCLMLLETRSDLEELEVRNRTWKARRVAANVAAFEHPEDLEVKIEDVQFALDFLDSLEGDYRTVTETKVVTSSEKLFKYLRKHPNSTKTGLRKSGAFPWHSDVNRELEQLKQFCVDGDFELLEEVGERNRTTYSIRSMPKQLTTTPDFHFQMSHSKDKAKDYKASQLSVDEMCKLMQNKTATNYSAGSFVDEHRKQVNWEGGNNCLILDIDNDVGELTIEKAKKIFQNFSYIIQPTKSHKIDKSGKGVKERFRVVFPTSEIRKMDVNRFRRISENFHKVFGITDQGDVKASGDTARFYYPSPHQAEYHEGEYMINWELYDRDDSNIAISASLTTREVSTEHASFFSKFNHLALGEKKRCHCPQHEDKNKSAFVQRNDKGNLQCCCSANCPTIFNK